MSGFDITGLGAVSDLVKTVVDKIWPDKTQVEKDQLALAMVALQGEIAAQNKQTDVNIEEAKNSNVFVSGWRPFIGWICGAAIAWNWIGLPISNAIAAAFHYELEVTPADLTQVLGLLFGMLGLGTLRTVEKVKGVAK